MSSCLEEHILDSNVKVRRTRSQVWLLAGRSWTCDDLLMPHSGKSWGSDRGITKLVQVWQLCDGWDEVDGWLCVLDASATWNSNSTVKPQCVAVLNVSKDNRLIRGLQAVRVKMPRVS